MQLAHSVAFGHKVANGLGSLPEAYYDAICQVEAAVDNVRWEAESDRAEARTKRRLRKN